MSTLHLPHPHRPPKHHVRLFVCAGICMAGTFIVLDMQVSALVTNMATNMAWLWWMD